VRLFKKFEAFLKHSKRNGGFSSNMSNNNNFEAFQRHFQRIEGFDYNCEAFIKIPRLFEDIFREIEGLIRNLRLF
jgi:hypothetical protein